MTPKPKFKVGQRVQRVYDGEEKGAKIIGIEPMMPDEPPTYHIEYDEGSDGWWPETALMEEIK